MRFSFFTSLLVVLVRVVSTDEIPFPDVIDLPVGFFPEGIDIGDGSDVYVGSISTGAIWKGNLQDGTGDILVRKDDDNPRPINGVKYDERTRSLYAAGRDSGKGYRYDGVSGALLDTFVFIDVNIKKGNPAYPAYINDIIITKNAVYFTDSFNPQLYVLPLTNQGEIDGDFDTLALKGDFEFVASDRKNRRVNANGIEATNDGTLIVVNSFTGKFYTVDPTDGTATEIDLGEDLKGVDGMLLTGNQNTLYAVQNRMNKILKIALAPDFATGVVVDVLENPELFDVPTTAALFGNSLYTPNAKFGTPSGGTKYEIVRTSLS